jgi:hypothetical protein
MHKKQRTQTKPWLKKRGPRWSLIGLMAVGLLLVVGLGTFAVATIGGKGDLNAVLRKAQLGAIPSGATDLQYAGVADSTYYLRFTASPEEIERFIADSPRLKVRAPQSLGPAQMYLPDSQREANPSEGTATIYYAANERIPWFDPQVREKGRMYAIAPDRHSNWTEVVIDDQKNTVYIRVRQR